MMCARLIVYLLLCIFGDLVAAETAPTPSGVLTFNIDPAKSTVQFTLGAVLHTVHGTFRIKSGAVRFDPNSGKASGQISVDVRSGNTGEGTRDRQMHANVLESERFPDAVFSPDRINGRLASNGASDVDVHGMLRIHGRDHEMTIPVRVQMQNASVTARAKFTVPYVSWGMRDPSTFVLQVAKSVDVDVTLEGR
ncbi:MAG TPA: YceI family protein [Chthoniobacterales bacterium]|nr:YceI family protein [Chthoniobacterales bacterium]